MNHVHNVDNLTAGSGALLFVSRPFYANPLMYLNMDEKARLCRSIHRVLKARGGGWITADVYVRLPDNRAAITQSKSKASFFVQHNIEANRFDSYEAAQAFFAAQGFELVEEAVPDYEALSVLPKLLASMPEELRGRNEPSPKIQAT